MSKAVVFKDFFPFIFFLLYTNKTKNTKFGLCTFLFVFTSIFFMKILNTHSLEGSEGKEAIAKNDIWRKMDGVKNFD